MQMVDRLKNTTQMQQQAYNTLDAMVEESYKYYQSSLEKKNETQRQLFPLIPNQKAGMERNASPASVV
jgi:hypothetical protein